ncbi:mucin-2-like [Cydia pomonella]|uniref:mucin-2-like n=1 Tax=Cydia pomonella TaxID=82600 RepID=UPI002ADE81CB|nr:mucin-2-like [Cydia pomonella]
MLRAACRTYAVLALWIAGAGARIYERCELARDLRGLGVRADHVATWVCIAFHESRFDTAARNPHSGDHGLLQISQLYWCGGGKACGLSCEDLRDDDISDDVACALHVYEEHTRLQDDGFLAWVVYPQHCKHNTKKYLADCDDTLKNASTNPREKSRALNVPKRTNLTMRLNQSIDELLPPYISMTSNSGHSRNEIDFQEKNYQSKWQVTQFSNIDDLSLPVFGLKTYQKTESPPTSTFALHRFDQSKRIDKDELRNKFVSDKPARTTVNTFNKLGSGTSKILTSSSSSWYTRPPPNTTTAKPKQAVLSSTVKTTTTGRPLDIMTTNLYHTTLISNSKSVELLHGMPGLSDKDASKKRFRCHGCRIPTTENPISSFRLTTTPEPLTTLIPKGGFKTFATSRTFSARAIISASTIMPSKNRSAHDNITSLITTTTPNTFTGRSRTTTAYTNKPRNKATSRNSFTTSNLKMPITFSTTPRSVTNTNTTTSSSSRHWRTLASKSAADSSRDTQDSQRNAIFDLYLKPKQPKLIALRFTTQSDSVYRRRIFADGTTSPATPWKRNGAQEFRIK